MSSPDSAVLRPLWSVVIGCTCGAAAALASPAVTPGADWALVAAGLAAGVAGLARHPKATWVWFLAGLALGAGRGLDVRAAQLRIASWLSSDGTPVALRVEATVREAWGPTRWGRRTHVAVRRATRGDQAVRLPGTLALEVRGSATRALPEPGATVSVLAELRGEARRPALVAASALVLREVAAPSGLHALRGRLVQATLRAAGTRPGRIRAAELAGALALGRRDLLPKARRDAWRRSGLAHLLAVSGLHVGVVAGSLWLTLAVLGVRPNTVRWALLVAVPGYAVLAGASPSALRAAAMASVWLGARLLGRTLVPMAAVLVAVAVMLAAAPTLIHDPGFQLTVLVTAALVRWVPVLAAALPGPRAVAAAAAVPVVAQAAAAPLVAWHFRTVLPGAAVVNLAAAPLLAPALLAAIGAVALAPVAPAVAGLLLDGLSGIAAALWWIGGAARAGSWTVPAPNAALIAAAAVAAVAALLPARAGRLGLVAWTVLTVATGAWWWLRPTGLPQVALLPVSDGTSVVLEPYRDGVLVDGGRFEREALLARADGAARTRTVVGSHADADHVGGLVSVLEAGGVRRLVIPRWSLADPAVVPLLRAVRRGGGVCVPVAEGSVVADSRWRLEVLWPPAVRPPGPDNERSLVVRARLEHGTVLVTSDIGREIEGQLARTHDLRCDVLIAPHHGSRTSLSPTLLAAASPSVVLVPAGVANPHHHPHPEVTARLDAADLPWRAPRPGQACGARPTDAGWRAVP